MLSPFKAPRIRAKDPLSNKDGTPTNAFVRFWDTFCKLLEQQEASQTDLLTQIQAVQADQADQLDLILEVMGLANSAQATADTALSVATAAATGTATDMTSVTGAFSTTAWTALADIAFPDRLAAGYWTVEAFLSGSTSGTGGTDIELRFIEVGAASALTSILTTAPNGPDTVIATDFLPPNPLPQTRPAGDITIRLEGRKILAGNTTSITGSMNVTYIPKP